MQCRHVRSGHEHAARTFVEHERHWRIDELHRAGRARRTIRRPMRIAVAELSRVPICVQGGPKARPIEADAMLDERWPIGRPAKLVDQLAWQTERKVEAADPWAGAYQQRLEFREGLQ